MLAERDNEINLKSPMNIFQMRTVNLAFCKGPQAKSIFVSLHQNNT